MEQDPKQIEALLFNIKEGFTSFYSGSFWVTDCFLQKTSEIDSHIAFLKPDHFTHNMAAIIAHMLAWRNFCIERINGNNEFDIKTNTDDWPEVLDLNSLLKEFRLSQKRIISMLDQFKHEKWSEIVEGRKYNYGYLLNGILQHDIYHFGQIGLIHSYIKKIK